MGNVFPVPRDDTASSYPGWVTGIVTIAIILGLVWLAVIIIVVIINN